MFQREKSSKASGERGFFGGESVAKWGDGICFCVFWQDFMFCVWTEVLRSCQLMTVRRAWR